MQCNNSCKNSCLIQQITELFHFLYKYGKEIGAGGWNFDRDIVDETVTVFGSF